MTPADLIESAKLAGAIEGSLSALVPTKIVCKSKGSKVNATQTGDNRFSCDGLVVGKNRSVTITINGKLSQ